MKKIASLMLIVMLTMLPACGGGGAGDETNLSGTSAEVLASIIESASAALPEAEAMPTTFDDPLLSSNAGRIGLTTEEFEKYIDNAAVSIAAISTFAHEAAIFQAKDAAAAAELKRLIASGYDSGKWICVRPQQSCVIESGNYVLLAVGRTAHVDALVEAFKEAAGTTGEADIFFTF